MTHYAAFVLLRRAPAREDYYTNSPLLHSARNLGLSHDGIFSGINYYSPRIFGDPILAERPGGATTAHESCDYRSRGREATKLIGERRYSNEMRLVRRIVAMTQNRFVTFNKPFVRDYSSRRKVAKSRFCVTRRDGRRLRRLEELKDNNVYRFFPPRPRLHGLSLRIFPALVKIDLSF